MLTSLRGGFDSCQPGEDFLLLESQNVRLSSISPNGHVSVFESVIAAGQ